MYKPLIIVIISFIIYSKAASQDLNQNLPMADPVISRDQNSREVMSWSRHIIEVSHGEAFVNWADPWAWVFSCNYLYRLNQKIASGGGLGLQKDWTGFYPVVSANLILGNKSESLAAGFDMKFIFSELIEGSRIWFTAGCYYKNIFIKAMPTFLFGWPEEWYLEAGYSFNIKIKSH